MKANHKYFILFISFFTILDQLTKLSIIRYFSIKPALLVDDFGMSASELDYRQWTRKHVVACQPIKAGEAINPEQVVLKRTPSKSVFTNLESVYGKKVLNDIEIDQPLCFKDINVEVG